MFLFRNTSLETLFGISAHDVPFGESWPTFWPYNLDQNIFATKILVSGSYICACWGSSSLTFSENFASPDMLRIKCWQSAPWFMSRHSKCQVYWCTENILFFNCICLCEMFRLIFVKCKQFSGSIVTFNVFIYVDEFDWNINDIYIFHNEWEHWN